jgi:hypothetical protein
VHTKLAPDTLTELLGLRLNVAPVPAGEAMFGMPAVRAVMAGVRLGISARLARGEATSEAPAAELELHPAGARRVDPASETYVGTFRSRVPAFWPLAE